MLPLAVVTNVKNLLVRQQLGLRVMFVKVGLSAYMTFRNYHFN